MNAIFIDEGVFLSFLVRDDDERFGRVRSLFEHAEAGREKLETNELVLHEVVRVLEAKYSLAREAIVQVLEAVLGTRNLRVPGRSIFKHAVELYASGDTSFVEAYNTAYANQRGLRREEDVLEEAAA